MNKVYYAWGQPYRTRAKQVFVGFVAPFGVLLLIFLFCSVGVWA